MTEEKLNYSIIRDDIEEIKDDLLDLKKIIDEWQDGLMKTLQSFNQQTSQSLQGMSRDLQSMKDWLHLHHKNYNQVFLDQAYLESLECNKYIWWLSASQHYNLMLQVGKVFPEHEASRYIRKPVGLWNVPRY